MKDLFLSICRSLTGRPAVRKVAQHRGAHEGSHEGEVVCAGCGVVLGSGPVIEFEVPEKSLHCELCAVYSVVGERDPFKLGRDLHRHSLVAVIPEISATDLSAFQWALSAALQSASERDRAAVVAQRLQARLFDARHSYGAMRVQAYGEAMAYLSDGEYAMRDVSELRVLFSPEFLGKLEPAANAREEKYRDCDQWEERTRQIRKRVLATTDLDNPK